MVQKKGDLTLFAFKLLKMSGLFLVCCLISGGALYCWEQDDFGIEDAFLEEIKGLERDYHLLGDSCRIELRYWLDVSEDQDVGWKWNQSNQWLASEGNEVPLKATVKVPADGVYRVWLRRFVRANERSTVKMELAGANSGEYLFGADPISREELEQQQEEQNFRLEEPDRMETMSGSPIWIWEYHDIELKKGETTLSFSSHLSTARISTVFLSRSLSFVPNRSRVDEKNNLDKIFYRFRVREGAEGDPEYGISSLAVGFNWRWRPRGFSGQFYWRSSLNAIDHDESGPPVTSKDGSGRIRQGEWSSWVNATFCSTGAGPWFTLNLGLSGIDAGRVDVQLAWYPDEHAVLKSKNAQIYNSRAVLALPARRGRIDYPVPEEDSPVVKGMLREDFLANLRSVEEIHLDFIRTAEEAVDALGLPEDHPRPKKLSILTRANPVAPQQESTVRLLSLLGITETGISDRDLLQKYGMRRSLRSAPSVWAYMVQTHDPADPVIPYTVDRAIKRGSQNSMERDPYYGEDLHTGR